MHMLFDKSSSGRDYLLKLAYVSFNNRFWAFMFLSLHIYGGNSLAAYFSVYKHTVQSHFDEPKFKRQRHIIETELEAG